MSGVGASFFRPHTKAVETNHPNLKCPVDFAREVLESVGVKLSGAEINDFAADLSIQRAEQRMINSTEGDTQ